MGNLLLEVRKAQQVTPLITHEQLTEDAFPVVVKLVFDPQVECLDVLLARFLVHGLESWSFREVALHQVDELRSQLSNFLQILCYCGYQLLVFVVRPDVEVRLVHNLPQRLKEHR